MLEALVDGVSAARVELQHVFDKIQSGIPDGIPIRRWEIKHSLANLLRKGVWVFGGAEFVREGGKAAKADVEDDTEGPNVHRAVIFTGSICLEDFRCDVGWGATEGGGEGFFTDDFGEAEIGEFDVERILFGDEDVFRFDVAVNDVSVVLEGG